MVLLRKNIPQNHNLKTAAELGVRNYGARRLIQKLLWKIFPPYEVQLTLAEVKAFFEGREFCLSRNIIEPKVLSLAKVSESTVYSIRIDRIKPDHLALILITNVLGRYIGSGQYHVYRNMLSMVGNDMLKLWYSAQQELLKRGYCTPEEVEEHNQWIREQIKSAG